MSNSYYNAGSFPATGTPATSASMRAELALISGGFDRLPALSGNANKLVLINGAETGMTVLTPPAGDLVGTTATQTLTNKTISGTFTGSLTGAASLNVLKAGDTMTGNLVINTGVDSRVSLQSSGTTQGQIQTTGALVRFASNNALPLVLSTNGVDRATLDDVGNITFGSASATGVFKVQGNNTNDLAVFESTDASASAAPDVVLYRNSASPAVSDQIGVLIWRGKDSGGADQQYARLGAEITDPTAGSEDADLWFETTGAGVAAERMRLNAAGLSLASTSDLTLNKGTANGILYLNGSKVATSGSALTFDGTNVSNTGRYIVNAAGSVAGITDISLGALSGGAWLNTPSGKPGYLAIAGSASFYWDSTNLISYISAAEQMRLTSTGLGIGTSSPGARLHINSGVVDEVARFEASGEPYISLYDNGVRDFYLFDSTEIRLWGQANKAMVFATNNTEQMRLDSSGNLGIGTSSPGEKLQVAGAIRATGAVTANTTGGILAYQGSSTIMLGSWGADASTYGAIQFYQANSTGTINRTGMLLDSSGNLGLGVTPTTIVNATGSNGKGFQTDSLTIASYLGVDQTYFATNAYTTSYGGGWTYRATAAALAYIQQSGIHAWYNAPSGTAGNAISFTQAMTLDASGNLGLGVTPSATASPYKSIELFGAYWMGGNNTTPASYSYTNTYFDGSDKYKTSGFAASLYRQLNGTHSWFTAPSGTAGNAISFTQAMTLDASGNLGVGLTSPVGRITIKGQSSATALQQLAFQYHGNASNYLAIGLQNVTGHAQIMAGPGASLLFYTNSDLSSTNERARITDVGNQIDYQPAESAQNTSVTLTAANLQAQIITSNAAVTLTLPTGTGLEGYTSGMATDTAVEVTFIATTANAITIGANGNTTVGNLTVSGNTSGTFRFRKTATNTFTVYRIS